MITNPQAVQNALEKAIIKKAKKAKKIKSKVVILSVIKKTACGFHAWVETNKGIFRKPLNQIPATMLK